MFPAQRNPVATGQQLPTDEIRGLDIRRPKRELHVRRSGINEAGTASTVS
jgi:hypothetical protein